LQVNNPTYPSIHRHFEQLSNRCCLSLSLTTIIFFSPSLNWVEIFIVEVAELWNLFIGGLSLIEQKLDLCLKLRILAHASQTTSCFDILFAVESSTIISDS